MDESLHERIISGAYIDFAKLLPHDRIVAEEDGRMDLVVCNGKAFWVPVSEGSPTNIGSFSKLEQAFRVYSNIYTSGHPDQAGQLIEYNHVIHTIAQTFIWDNVYAYDKEFRLHMVQHSERNWSIILQLAWSMKLRDRIFRHDGLSHSNAYSYSSHNNGHSQNNSKGGKSSSADYCRHFQKGKCYLGKECAYEHQCTYCHKFGHGVIVCLKLIFDHEKSGGKPNVTRHEEGGISTGNRH